VVQPSVLSSLLKLAQNPPLAIHFIDNTDPAGIDSILTRLRLPARWCWLSPNLGTPEPRNGMIEVKLAYTGQNLTFLCDCYYSIDSKLDKLAKRSLAGNFPMYDWVGGRTSEMSAVGLLPAALQE